MTWLTVLVGNGEKKHIRLSEEETCLCGKPAGHSPVEQDHWSTLGFESDPDICGSCLRTWRTLTD